MATVSYLQRKADDSNRTGYSFTSCNFGDEDSDRKIVVIVAGQGTPAISSVTIGGVAATITDIGEPAFALYKDISVAVASVPTGTTGTISVSYAGTMTGCAIFTYRAVGLTSNTPTATSATTATPGSGSLAIPRDGAVFALGTTNESSGSIFSWSSLSKNYDGNSAEGTELTVASGLFSGTYLSQTITCTDTTNGGAVWIGLASFPTYNQFTNPGNVYASDDSYATCAATSGALQVDLSIDGGETYSDIKTLTFTGTESTETCGNGSTELWGLAPTRADMVNANFRLRITHGQYSQVYSGFGFATGTDLLTGIEVTVEAKYASSTISVDHIQVKIYYGTSTLPIQAGSMAYASNGRKAGEGVGAGTGVLVFNDGSTWIACDTGATVAA